jgi:coenzyme Q-binding protein COQ10
MTTHCEMQVIAASCDQVFELVADVERYPEFLSLWRRAHVYHRDGDVYLTNQEIGLGPICECFRTRTELRRPQRIEVTSEDWLFHTFHIVWRFEPVRGGCRVSIALTWETRSRPLQRGIDLLLPTVARTMVRDFGKRADQVLGGSSSGRRQGDLV